jgi:protein arginine N-methyltransferase 1
MSEPLRHLGMVLDEARLAAYRRALAATVRPGATVADVGAGCGVLAVLACRAGAGRVYAVEPDPILAVARDLAAANGCADRVVLVPGRAEEVELPERVELVVADLRGTLPLQLPALEALAVFTERWLAPGGTLVPRRDVVWAAPCRHAGSLHRRAGRAQGVDLGPLAAAVADTWWRQDLPAAALVAPPRRWNAVTYPWRTAALAGRLAWSFGEPAPVHGLAAWFEAELAEGIGYSTAPGAAGSSYGQAFFPFGRDLELEEGDALEVDLRANPAGGGFLWTWAARQRRGDEVLASVRHSTFYPDAPVLLGMTAVQPA